MSCVCRAFSASWLKAIANSCKLAAGPVNSNSELGTSFGEKLQRGVASALVDLKTLAKHPVYVLNVAATAVYTGTTMFAMAIQLHMQPQTVLSAQQCSPAAGTPPTQPTRHTLLEHSSASSISDMSSKSNLTQLYLT